MEPHTACKAAVNWIKSRAAAQTHNLFVLVNNAQSVQLLLKSQTTKNAESGLPSKSRKVQKSVSCNDDGQRIPNTRRRKI